MIMPIKPENRHRYPPNWREIRAAILDRAGHCCEQCSAPNHWTIQRVDDGWRAVDCDYQLAMVWPAPGEIQPAIKGVKETRIVLTTAHLDHTPENCDPRNLRAWCQRCHLTYDAKHHAQSAAATRRANRRTAEMFA